MTQGKRCTVNNTRISFCLDNFEDKYALDKQLYMDSSQKKNLEK